MRPPTDSHVFDAIDLGATAAERDFDAVLDRLMRHRASAAGAEQLHVGDAVREAHEPHVTAVAMDRGTNLVEGCFDARRQGLRLGHDPTTATG